MSLVHLLGSNIEIGNRIREVRIQAAMTQTELAGAVGLDQSEISRIERGERTLSVVCLVRIASALAVPAQSLLEI